MKANRPQVRACIVRACMATAVPALLLAGCSEKRVIPAPSPSPAPRPTPAPLPPAAPATNWRAAPQSPGDWTYLPEPGGSAARFAGGKLVVRCNRAAATVSIEQPATATSAVPVTIQTTALRRTLTASPQGTAPVLAAVLPAGDPLLDAMTFSRGRFAVETPGLEPLYVPSWTEFGRVIQDCR